MFISIKLEVMASNVWQWSSIEQILKNETKWSHLGILMINIQAFPLGNIGSAYIYALDNPIQVLC